MRPAFLHFVEKIGGVHELEGVIGLFDELLYVKDLVRISVDQLFYIEYANYVIDSFIIDGITGVLLVFYYLDDLVVAGVHIDGNYVHSLYHHIFNQLVPEVEDIADHCLFMIFDYSLFFTQIDHRLKLIFCDSGQVSIALESQQPHEKTGNLGEDKHNGV